MKITTVKITFTLLFSFLLTSYLYGQENTSIAKCNKLLNSGFISTGQEYKAQLDENNKAKVHTTFYGGSQYRVIACTDNSSFPLVFSVYDKEKNLLFCNIDYDYTPYWNFTFTSTIDCIIEIELMCDKPVKDEVLLLIGFKEK